MSSKEKNERLSLALKKNLKKRKIFQKKIRRKMILNDKQIIKLAEVFKEYIKDSNLVYDCKMTLYIYIYIYIYIW